MSAIEPYPHLPAACIEYDPLAPEVARLVAELIVSKSAALRSLSVGSGLEAPPGDNTRSDPAEVSINAIGPNSAELLVEHIGSTAVPECAGKGVIDLMLLYGEGGLEHAKQVLDSLGFQAQGTRDPFPESRPMRLGALSYKGKQYRLHVHVISATSEEAAGLLGFRDALRGDAELRRSYVDRKRAIIAAGVIDSVDYSDAKGEFISGYSKWRAAPIPESSD